MAPWRKTTLLRITRSSTSTRKRSESLQWETLRGNWKHSFTVSLMFSFLFLSWLLFSTVASVCVCLCPVFLIVRFSYAMFPLHGMSWLISTHPFFCRCCFFIAKNSVYSKQSSLVQSSSFCYTLEWLFFCISVVKKLWILQLIGHKESEKSESSAHLRSVLVFPISPGFLQPFCLASFSLFLVLINNPIP